MAERPVVAVLGLGQTGAALALGLRGCGLFGSVVGWDPDFDAARAGKRLNVADRFVNNAPEAARQAALVFVALRGEQLVETLTAIGPHLRPGAVACSVTELHETASAVAARTLPANVSFLNADPIAWGDDGAVGGEGDMPGPAQFQKGIWCISPLATAHEDAVGFVAQVGEKLGMEPFFLDAREHDALGTGLTLLPAVLAAAQVRVASGQPSWREMRRLAGGTFRRATAPAGDPPEEQQSAVAGSREHLVRWLDLLLAELGQLRDALNDGQEPGDYFESAHLVRAQWLAGRDLPAQAAELPTVETAPRRRFPF